MAFAIIIKADSSPIEAIFARLNQFNADKSKLFDEIGAGLVFSVQDRFFTGRDVDGNPWKMSWRAKLQGGQTLRDTGRLMNSYTHNVLVNGVEVGTNVEYAPYLHYGATIQPKNGQYITFAVAGQYRKVKQSVLPPRTQLGINADDEEMVLDIVGDFINDYILRGA
ncbi:phage virion morphogenesis protein [Acinetobacter towneri]|uniref:phage virion morphogenesis protein n=1 Tax=Acinetobacter towneri TaxID=202956 RepID=UPI00209724EF|nr:phage virion morphogenesis protein [Acinetobacter towneri]MCO8059137.1 phage virion morphogenesis protein [Acinetobacter towneri]MCO8064923.1 phage virion morphogenesis protein [Acinetobacter towneri]